MDPYKTVFELSDAAIAQGFREEVGGTIQFQIAWSMFLFAVCCLILWKGRGQFGIKSNKVVGIYGILVAFILGGFSVKDLSDQRKDYSAKADALRKKDQNGECKTVEGKVHLLSQQPFTGHSAGDKVDIGGTQLEISFFRYSFPAYHLTAAHGGVLREGVEARVTYCPQISPKPGDDDARIIKIDVR